MPAQPVSSDSHVFGNLPNVKKIENGGNVYTDFKSTGTRTFDDRRCCGDWALIQLGLGLDVRLCRLDGGCGSRAGRKTTDIELQVPRSRAS